MKPNQISKRLKEARERIGYTLLQACEKSGMLACEIARFEQGQEPTFAQLAKLAEIYRLTTEDLMSDKPIERPKMLWCR